jgi:flagellin-like protein
MASGADRGVSTVIGVVLVVAITVIVAAVVGATALGFTDRLPNENPTNVAYDETYHDGSGPGPPSVNVTITAGRVSLSDSAYVADESGNRVDWEAVWSGGEYLEAGETFVIDGVGPDDGALDRPCDRETYRVVDQSANNESTEVVIQVTAGTAAPGATGC